MQKAVTERLKSHFVC